MFSHLKEATIFTLALIAGFFRLLWFVIVALSDWLKGFASVDTWFFKFFLVKVVIILIGLIMTPFPFWVLVFLSFLPPPILAPLFFITLIIMLAHF